ASWSIWRITSARWSAVSGSNLPDGGLQAATAFPLTIKFPQPASAGAVLQFAQYGQGFALRTAATVSNGLKRSTNRRPRRIGKNIAVKISVQMNTAHPGRFALRHTGNG